MSCCLSGSICFELIKGLPAAFVTLIIGVIAAAIAFRQYRVAKAKLKLDLFEKRYAIFQQVWAIFSEVVLDGGVKKNNYGLATPFNNFLPQAAFLFGKSIENYLAEAVKKWTEMGTAETYIEQQGADLQQWAEKRRVLSIWFEEQASRGLKRVFGPYLNFEEWK